MLTLAFLLIDVRKTIFLSIKSEFLQSLESWAFNYGHLIIFVEILYGGIDNPEAISDGWSITELEALLLQQMHHLNNIIILAASQLKAVVEVFELIVQFPKDFKCLDDHLL